MKVAGQKRKRVFSLAMLLCFLLGACSENTSFRRGLKDANNLESTPANSPVKLNTENARQVEIDNGIVSVKLSKPEGFIIGISYPGIDNVLDTKNKEDDRGYFDVVWGGPGQRGGFQRIHGTSFSVITADENITEVSFLRTWTSSMGGTSVPVNIDQRYIMRRGDSGFYSYVIFERPPGFPAATVTQIRNVFKLNEDRFHYMAISDTRQRSMPTQRDRETGQPLAYPEAVLLTHPSNSQFKGEVDDKYQYSSENQDNSVNGWITTDSQAHVGFWILTPSNEFRSAGPLKQDLTSHVGPTLLSMLVSTHYAGKDVTMIFQEGETYTKVFGPVFLYLNSAPSNVDVRSLWSNAVQQLSNEVKSWPYDFLRSKDFLPPNQRGTVRGRLQVQDGGHKPQYANNAYVGLALPGYAGSWQTESKGYQFWTRTDPNGNYVIKNIVPGQYNLYAWVPGFIGDYRYDPIMNITPGCSINLSSLVYSPPRNGPTLWEIGIPDRSAAEFYVPDPDPTLVNNLYKNDTTNKFRQYGLWQRYTDLYPNQDLVYTVGVSDYKKDWFFAHVTRNTNNTYQPTTWQIIFELPNNTINGNYTLQLALASASYSEAQVWFNDPSANRPYFTTRLIGSDNVIPRHGIHGLYGLYSIVVSGDLLVKGKNNTMYLRQSRAKSAFEGVMYDYIRLESLPTPPT